MTTEAILEKARAFIKDKLLSEKDKEICIYRMGVQFGTMPAKDLTSDVLSRYYDFFYKKREKRVEYRIVRITNNLADYPDCERDTVEFPHLVECVTDEMNLFVVREDNDTYYHSSEFFYMVEVKRFEVIST